jgi:hypothetical protein
VSLFQKILKIFKNKWVTLYGYPVTLLVSMVPPVTLYGYPVTLYGSVGYINRFFRIYGFPTPARACFWNMSGSKNFLKIFLYSRDKKGDIWRISYGLRIMIILLYLTVYGLYGG